MDLESGAVVFVGEGKCSAALSRPVGERAQQSFWRSLKASRANVEAVAIDMSTAYYKTACDNLADAAVVFDGFHIVKLLNARCSTDVSVAKS